MSLSCNSGPDQDGPVPGIEPYKGFTLHVEHDQDGDGFWFPCFYATGPGGTHYLHVSRFQFTPTQARFNWLVDWGFPTGRIVGGKDCPLTDTMIDGCIAGERDCGGADLRTLAAGHQAFLEMEGGRR